MPLIIRRERRFAEHALPLFPILPSVMPPRFFRGPVTPRHRVAYRSEEIIDRSLRRGQKLLYFRELTACHSFFPLPP